MPDRATAEAIDILTRDVIEPMLETLAELQIAVIAACHARGSIDLDRLLLVLDVAASDPASPVVSRAIVEKVSSAVANLR